MTKHIGIVGCSAEGAALCYKTICIESADILGEHAHPEVSVHTLSLADYVRCLDAGDTQGVANLMLTSAQKLKDIGAEFLICPDNTIHQAFHLVEMNSPLPWLHIADVLVRNAKSRGFKKLGLTGTKWLVDSAVYDEACDKNGLELVKPDVDTRIAIGRIIMDELVKGDFKEESISYFQNVVSKFAEQDCGAVIMGCTEIPLILNDENSELPTLDSNKLLAQAAINAAITS